jgi:hypothetical protein
MLVWCHRSSLRDWNVIPGELATDSATRNLGISKTSGYRFRGDEDLEPQHFICEFLGQNTEGGLRLSLYFSNKNLRREPPMIDKTLAVTKGTRIQSHA